MIRAFRVTAETELAARAAQATAERLTERGLVAAADGFPLQFRLQAADAEAPISLAVTESGCVLAAREQVDFFTAAGVFLRRLRFLDGGAEAPVWIQAVTPRCAVRGAYFASHFHNWYITAPEAEQTRYLEDMALWGFNTLMAAFPMIDLLSGDCEEYHTQAARMVSLFRAAHELGMGVCTLPNVNSGYREFPKDWAGAPHADPLRRRGNSGNMLCPAKPGVQDWIDKDNHRFYRWLTECGVDMLITWPYDEGGCACPDCYPWGAKGFLRGSKRAFEMARNYFPNVKRILSTWMFDTPEEGEWDALTESLEEDRWCDMILADSHEDYPRYPLDKGVPGGLPLLNFPEISMWGLYPWGGWGATALPERITRFWRQTGDKLSGGFLYSEGLFEDINKVIVAQLYFWGDRDPDETLREYAIYELGIADAAPFLELVHTLEKTHTAVATAGMCDLGDVARTYELACEIDEALPQWAKRCFRWRQIFLRAVLDSRRYPACFARFGKMRVDDEDWKALLREDEVCIEAFRELVGIYHSVDDFEEDPYHRRVRPLLS